uniref:Uncharacterized protein n=1 Tax=Ralstonia solanacearum TaxID=305 RepID=A0A0S4TLM6_RALSL|nr:protein of unknown function [Ralstonia solanacearum]
MHGTLRVTLWRDLQIIFSYFRIRVDSAKAFLALC